MEKTSTITAKTVTSLRIKLNLMLTETMSDKFRTDVKMYIAFMECTPYAEQSRVDVTLDYYHLMRDLLNYLEIEGINSPFYGLKSQTEKIMRYF